MSQICKDLETAGYILVRSNRDGIDVVEAKRTATASISTKEASKLLLALARNQEEALAFMRGPIAAKLSSIEATIKRGLCESDEARAIYEFNALLFGNDGKSSDGYTWEALMKGVK